MSDLPDWVQAQSNSGVELVGGTLAAGLSKGQSITGNQSLVLYAFASLAASPVVLQIDWYTDDTLGSYVTTQHFTAAAEPGFAAQIMAEIPCYAGAVKITNLSPGGITFSVVGSARVVTVPRILNSTGPGRWYQFTGSFVSGTGIRLLAADGGDNNFASNAQTQLLLAATANGELQVNYVDQFGNAIVIGVIAYVAGTTGPQLLALPQGMIGFTFVPSANGPGVATLYTFPAQL